MEDAVIYELSGGVGTLVLNRPERHNALGAEELGAMLASFETVRHDPEVRVLVVTGAGEKTFSSGVVCIFPVPLVLSAPSAPEDSLPWIE